MPKVKTCAGKDAFERMNYLYQISNYLADKNKCLSNLSPQYLELMLNISKKTVQRIDIEIKRTICKRCKTPQIPDTSARVRVKKKQVKWTCCKCNKTKTFNVRNPTYVPWNLTEEAVVETLNYTTDE